MLSWRVLAAAVRLPRTRYADGETQTAFYDRALRGLTTAPGVRDVSLVQRLPLEGLSFIDTLARIDDTRSGGELPTANYRVVGPDYMRTMGLTITRGRMFTDQDPERRPLVINERAAQALWRAENPIGQLVHATSDDEPPRTIIGVAANARIVNIRGGGGRVRAALEGSRELRFAKGRTVTPSIDLGVRRESGGRGNGDGSGDGLRGGLRRPEPWADGGRGAGAAAGAPGTAATRSGVSRLGALRPGLIGPRAVADADAVAGGGVTGRGPAVGDAGHGRADSVRGHAVRHGRAVGGGRGLRDRDAPRPPIQPAAVALDSTRCQLAPHVVERAAAGRVFEPRQSRLRG